MSSCVTFAIACLSSTGCGSDDPSDGAGGDEEPAHMGQVQFISAGDASTCVTASPGRAFCWGDNTYGQLGDGTHTSHAVPVAVTMVGTTMYEQIHAGKHACAVTTAQFMECWGDGTTGALGAGTMASSTVPQPVPGTDLAFLQADVGGSSCALAVRTPYCWGANDVGQLGTGDLLDHLSPTPIEGLELRFISVGERTACGTEENGALWCWGDGTNGELGTGGFGISSAVPLRVPGDRQWQPVSVGGSADGGTVCASTWDGEAYCWGANAFGQVGDGTTERRNVPTRVVNLPYAGQMVVGAQHVCAIAGQAAAYCWGAGGTLGNGSAGGSLTPVLVTGGHFFSALTAGARHTCGRTDNSDQELDPDPVEEVVLCWGRNESGQLGDGTRTDRSAPVRVLGQP